jgi:hypothetical protein
MLHEFRTYGIAPGGLPTYISAFNELALPVIRRHMNILGFWTSDTGDLNQVYHLWAFENDGRRREQFAAVRQDPVFADQFLPIVLPIMRGMRSIILTPTVFDGGLPLFTDLPDLQPIP